MSMYFFARFSRFYIFFRHISVGKKEETWKKSCPLMMDLILKRVLFRRCPGSNRFRQWKHDI